MDKVVKRTRRIFQKAIKEGNEETLKNGRGGVKSKG